MTDQKRFSWLLFGSALIWISGALMAYLNPNIRFEWSDLISYTLFSIGFIMILKNARIGLAKDIKK